MSSYRRRARLAYNVAAWLFAAAVAVQVYLAGFGIFAAADDFSLHRNWGYLLGLVSIVFIVLAVLARPPRRVIGATVVIFVLIMLQSVFVAMRGSVPAFAALHPLNGFLILLIAIGIAWSTRSYLRAGSQAQAVTPAGQNEAEADAQRV